MARRRGDTRGRIQEVALELFAERGYQQTSLREVADRLEITRPALYYHFGTKEEILGSVVDDLGASIDELVDWASAQPRTPRARRQILERIAALLSDRWQPLVRFTMVNQGTLADLPEVGERLRGRMMGLLSLLGTPDGDAVQQFQARLAVIALFLGNAPPPLFDLGIGDDERADVALAVATMLVTPDDDAAPD